MKTFVFLALAALVVGFLLAWDIHRHGELEDCVIHGGATWVDDRCCPLLVGNQAWRVTRCASE